MVEEIVNFYLKISEINYKIFINWLVVSFVYERLDNWNREIILKFLIILLVFGN